MINNKREGETGSDCGFVILWGSSLLDPGPSKLGPYKARVLEGLDGEEAVAARGIGQGDLVLFIGVERSECMRTT